jgi:hypothetical protein
MYRIDNSTAVPNLPAPKQPGPTSPGFFSNGNEALGAPPTIVDDDWMNAVQEELSYVIEQSGLVLNKTDRTQLFQALGRLTRVRLQADTTFYVAPSPLGNDNNNGLTEETPWADATFGYNWLRDRIDPNGHQVFIQCAPGTYAPALFDFPIVGGPFTLLGNETDPSQVVFFNPNGTAILALDGAVATIRGITVRASGPSSGGHGIDCQASRVAFNNIFFDTCAGAQMAVDVAGLLAGSLGPATTYTIIGSANNHCLAVHAGLVQVLGQVTISGNPTFPGGFVSVTAAQSDWVGAQFNGTAHGPRYNARAGGIITTETGNPNFFPGDAAGVNDGTGIVT